MSLWLFTALATAVSWAKSGHSVLFAETLEQCIRDHAAAAAASHAEWANSCMPPTEKIDRQAMVYEETLVGIRDQYGYPAALWCAFYSMRMTGQEYDPNDTQPNNPNYGDWYRSFLCPWDVETCADDDLGLFGDEWKGVPVEGAPNQNALYLTTPPDPYVTDEPDRRTMSCGLCGHLRRKLGDPPFTIEPVTVNEALYTSNWDFHPFGAWLANDAAMYGRDVDMIVRNINVWRASNGEEIHGYLWQSTRLLAYNTGKPGALRKLILDEAPAVAHVLRACRPSWWLAPQSRDDCSHAAGASAVTAIRLLQPPLQRTCWSYFTPISLCTHHGDHISPSHLLHRTRLLLLLSRYWPRGAGMLDGRDC